MNNIETDFNLFCQIVVLTRITFKKKYLSFKKKVFYFLGWIGFFLIATIASVCLDIDIF